MKLKFNLKNRKVSLKVLAASWIIIAILCGSLYVYGQGVPNTAIWISSGSYPRASYTIFIDSAEFFCKDRYGQIMAWSGTTNATDIIQDTIDAAGNNDWIHIEEGKYDDLVTIVLKSNLTITGDGWTYLTDRGTVLECVNGFTGNLFTLNGTNPTKEYRGYLTIRDLCFSLGPSDGGNGIQMQYTIRNVIDRCYFRNANVSCVDLDAVEQTRITNCFFHGYGTQGIRLLWCSSMYIERNEFASSYETERGILVSTSLTTFIKSNTFYFSQYGIEIYNKANNTIIESCSLWQTARDAIYIHDGYNNIIANTIIVDAGSDGAYSGILLAGANNTLVHGCRIYDTGTGYQTNGITETGTSDYNSVISCNTRGVVTNGIIMVGANSHTAVSWNSTTWCAAC